MKILTCVDLRATEPEHLVQRGLQLATRTDAVMDLFYVEHPGADVSAAQARLDALLTRVPERWRGRARIEQGDPTERLVAASRAYDCMVVGPRAPGALENLLKGPMARRILSSAHCAVYVPRSPEPWPPDDLRVLIGVDLEATHDSLVQEAAWWAQQFRGRLDAMFAERALPQAPSSRVTRQALERELGARRTQTLQRLQEVLDRLVPERFRGTARHGTGDAEDALRELTDQYDLVVVGTVPRPGLTGRFVGSVAQNIVRSARCDVLTLPSVHRRAVSPDA